MCRLLAFAAPQPTSIDQVLGPEETAQFQQMARLHDDGWGCARRDTDGELTRVRSAASGLECELLAAELHRPGASAEIVHLRLATDDMEIDERNTHPFARNGMAMAHNGSIVPTDPIRALLKPELLADLEGDTDSELYFALVRQYAAEGAAEPDAFAEAALALREVFPAASLNAMLLSERHLCVLRSSAHATPPWEDFVASGLSDDELPRDHVEAYFRMHYHQEADGTCAFTSVGLNVDAWEELPEDHLASVDLSTLELTIRPLADIARAER